MSPTDMQHQLWAQALGGDGYAMAFVLAATFLLMLCVVGIIGSVLEARQRRIDDELIASGYHDLDAWEAEAYEVLAAKPITPKTS